MLKITRKMDPITVSQLVACVYSAPGIGKTTLAFTANEPLLLDFDGGAYRAGNRGDTVQVSQWQDVVSISREDLANYSTVVVDTAGRALDMLSEDIIRRNPKMGRGGALTLQGYGQLKAEFMSWTKMVRNFGKDVILLAHASEEKNGDDVIERIDVQGGSKGEIYKVSDLMGRLSIKNGKRILNFSPTDTSFGKNPASLPATQVPDFKEEPEFFAVVLNDVKSSLNRLGEDQKAIMQAMEEWRISIQEASNAEQYNELMPKTAAADKAIRDNVKRLLVSEAAKKGVPFDKKAKAFVDKEETAE